MRVIVTSSTRKTWLSNYFYIMALLIIYYKLYSFESVGVDLRRINLTRLAGKAKCYLECAGRLHFLVVGIDKV